MQPISIIRYVCNVYFNICYIFSVVENMNTARVYLYISFYNIHMYVCVECILIKYIMKSLTFTNTFLYSCVQARACNHLGPAKGKLFFAV